MKVPREPFVLKVGGIDYTVGWDDKRTDLAQVWGITVYRNQAIWLDPGQGEQMAEQTFVHEMIHAVMEGSGLNKAHYGAGKTDAEMEAMVTPFAHLLYQVLKDNPGIFGA